MVFTLTSAVFASAHTTRQAPRSRLEKLPLSGGVLMARALRSGAVKLPSRPAAHPNRPFSQLPNVRMSTGTQPVNETPITSDPTNGANLLAGANDYNCGSLTGFYTSTDGGLTWSGHCFPSVGAGGCGDPTVGYDRNGTSYIAGIEDCDGFSGSIYFQKSTNNGGSWSQPNKAVSATLGGITDKEWLEVDRSASSPFVNCVYISVTQIDSSFTKTTITVSHSCDGGNTWTTKAVDTQHTVPVVDQFSDIGIAADGTVYASWMQCQTSGPTGDCGGTTVKMLVTKSTDGGSTWTRPTQIARVKLAPDTCGAYYGCVPNTSERVSNLPVIEVDKSSGPYAGNVYAAYYNWTGSFMRVLVSTSTDDGATWGAGVPVGNSNSHDQWFQWVSVNPSSGKVGATWWDRRRDPNNVKYDVFAASSLNGGASFNTNKLVTTAMSDPFDDGFGSSFFGDYSTNIFAGQSLYVAWCDTRNGSVCQGYSGGRTQ
jgi:hypothetical protein